MENTNLINLNGITKEYSPGVGCFDIKIKAKSGEVFGFIGPNGAGKTTVIRQMVGFIKSDKGTGTILGLDIWSDTKNIMRDLGYIAGEVSLPEDITGWKYLKSIAGIRKNVEWSYVEKLIKYFEFDPKKKIKKMSKGMKQKVAIITAFMHKPKIMILDEPTSGLDPLMQEKFNTLILNAKKEGATIFMSSHIFGEIDNTCDRVAVIKKGTIVSEINMVEMKNDADRIYSLSFSTKESFEKAKLKKWVIQKEDIITKTMTIKISKKNVNAFLSEISEMDLSSFKEIPFSLEAHFMKFYGEETKFND
ncbi:ABC transporter ATP-binding protein [Williamsoniiplasma somnilux]|uniref:ABC transporter ATP-binding protein n=1 Tax=Williamsoniiplasma somnilux TaxID=215578 RepID=A0A2K8NYX8_9MOLU|nr:ATP-binding cassette domain-containing protein [Williamsoniiplasma somnilux]ATZ18418.1 ABC transporter ATP-binding protein [Williamsoniiplasma somnilux]